MTTPSSPKTPERSPNTPDSAPKVPTWLKSIFSEDRLRLLRFCVVGASGVVVNLGVFEAAFVAFSFVASNAIGISVSIFTNFLLNDRWTWADRDKGPFLRRLVAFYIVSLSAAVVQLAGSWVCYEWLNIHRHLSLLLGIAAATGINFVSNNLWTFRSANNNVPTR